jgi:Protein of unknown function (DUF551).
MSQWISVKDRLPDIGTKVLGFLKNGYIFIVSQCTWEDDICNEWHIIPESYSSPFSVPFDDLVYWMPLPAAPVDSEEEKQE